MKIGFFTSIEGWGGSETYLLSLMTGVREAGHVPVLFGIEGTRLLREARDVGIACVVWKVVERGENTPHPGPLPQGERQEGLRGLHPRPLGERVGVRGNRWIHWVPAGVRLLLGNVKEAWSLRKVFRQHPVDVLHINLNGYEVAGVAARMCGIPSIGWHCIMPFRDPSAMRRWLIRWTCRSYSLMGGMSHACVDAWRELSGLPNPRCRMVWNGIDLALYDGPGPVQRLPRDPFVVLAVGRLHPMKGFDVLIRAMGKLNDPRAHLIIAGEGQEKAALTALAVQQPCTDAITFAGHREDMVSMYLAAHCMALPSISHESFGFVLAEAMACGLPLITSDFGPLPEINLHNVTGLVVPAGAPDTLAHAISAIMDNPELGRHFGESGRQRAQECFSRQRMIDEMIKIYISMTHPQGSGLVAGHSSQVRMGQCGEMHYMRR